LIRVHLRGAHSRSSDVTSTGGETAPRAQGRRGVLVKLVERPWSDAGIEARVGVGRDLGSCAFWGNCAAPLPLRFLTAVPVNLYRKGIRGRSAWVSPSTRTGGTQPECEAVLLVLSSRAWRGPRTDESGVWCSWSALVNRQLLLDALPRLRSGIGSAPPFTTRVSCLHLDADALDRSATRPMATRRGARPGTCPTGCPRRQLRTRGRRRRLTGAHRV